MTKRLDTAIKAARVTRTASHNLKGKSYIVHYIDNAGMREAGFALLGYVYEGKIYISDDLPSRVEHGVFRHEVYHTEDTHKWLGKYGKEMRANTHTALQDPLCFLATLVYSLKPARLKTYWRLYVHPRNLN